MGKITRSRQLKLLKDLEAKANIALTVDSVKNFRYLSRRLRALQSLIEKVNAEFPGSLATTTQARFASDLPNLVESLTLELEALLDAENLGESSSSSSSQSSVSSNSSSSSS